MVKKANISEYDKQFIIEKKKFRNINVLYVLILIINLKYRLFQKNSFFNNLL